MGIRNSLAVILAALMAAESAAAQAPQVNSLPPAQTAPSPIQQPLAPAERDHIRLSYTLGPADQILVRVPQAEEINDKAFRVDAEGNIVLPVVGSVRAEGMTVQQLEAELTRQLLQYYRNPLVTITVVQFRADPVTFVGAFRNPGIYSLQGGRTLVEMLAVAGGLASNASNRLRITRRLEWGKLPLAAAVEDKERNVSYAEISINRLMETLNPEEDIVLQAYDVIRAGVEEMVYVTGEGIRSGAFPLADKDALSISQVVVLSGGLANARGDRAKVMRQILNTSRRSEIPVDLTAIMEGRANDFPLLPNDILVVPARRGGVKSLFSRYLVVTLPALATSLVVVAIRR
jgi:polysaccharide export outer membrane protein